MHALPPAVRKLALVDDAVSQPVADRHQQQIPILSPQEVPQPGAPLALDPVHPVQALHDAHSPAPRLAQPIQAAHPPNHQHRIAGLLQVVAHLDAALHQSFCQLGPERDHPAGALQLWHQADRRCPVSHAALPRAAPASPSKSRSRRWIGAAPHSPRSRCRAPRAASPLCTAPWPPGTG